MNSLISTKLFVFMLLLLVIAILMLIQFFDHRRGPVPSDGAGEAEAAELDEFAVFPFQLIEIARLSPPERCAICRRRFRAHHRVTTLPRCVHIFHPRCIRPWLDAAGPSNGNCPLCRRSAAIESDTSTSDGSSGEEEGDFISPQLSSDEEEDDDSPNHRNLFEIETVPEEEEYEDAAEHSEADPVRVGAPGEHDIGSGQPEEHEDPHGHEADVVGVGAPEDHDNGSGQPEEEDGEGVAVGVGSQKEHDSDSGEPEEEEEEEEEENGRGEADAIGVGAPGEHDIGPGQPEEHEDAHGHEADAVGVGAPEDHDNRPGQPEEEEEEENGHGEANAIGVASQEGFAVVERDRFGRCCFGFIGPRKIGADPRGNGSSESLSHMVGQGPQGPVLGCFPCCRRVFKPRKFGVPGKEGGPGQHHRAGVRRCFPRFLNFFRS
ncbi:43kDa postsynaptic protein [Trema orientale]|uniref:43kDa postsynaptic protein n=1 Tax=Trema orientale TaxID=63057 RepID=A0A2P5EPU3_TREOI|nr:43kDa postsynaptic protein [Trema orientale]